MYIRSGYTGFIAKPFYLAHIQVTEIKGNVKTALSSLSHSGKLRPAGLLALLYNREPWMALVDHGLF